MQFQLNHSSDRAIYQQIVDQVKRDIAMGRLKKGEKLTTVRQLAEQLAINPNTIAKAFRILESEGIITTKPGQGAFIANLDSGLNDAVKHKIVCDQIERAVVDAFHMQIEKAAVAKIFNEILERFHFEKQKEKKDE